jgi:hypothetical protein
MHQHKNVYVEDWTYTKDAVLIILLLTKQM